MSYEGSSKPLFKLGFQPALKSLPHTVGSVAYQLALRWLWVAWSAGRRSLAGRRTAAVAEFAIKPVAGGDQDRRRDQARQDINDVMVSAVNRGEAEQDGDGQMDVADAAQITKGEVNCAQRDSHMAAGNRRARRLEDVVNPSHEAIKHAGLHGLGISVHHRQLLDRRGQRVAFHLVEQSAGADD